MGKGLLIWGCPPPKTDNIIYKKKPNQGTPHMNKQGCINTLILNNKYY